MARLAARHLLALGMPNYAFAAFRIPLFWSNERKEIFTAEVNRAGRACAVFDPERELPPHRRQKALSGWLRALPRPCGIFAANDYVGEEVVNACVQLGIAIPDEIAVLGVDNDEQICENLSPTLSSIAPDFAEGGYMAAELLWRLVEKPRLKPSVHLFDVTRIVTRQSTRRMACDRSRVASAVELIRRRACEGISVDDVVAGMGVSRRTAEMHFREATGHSILDEIDDIRFAKVFELLKNPRQSLDALPALCGFSTGVALRKAFRLRTGMSMRDWRKRHSCLAQK